MLLRCWLKNGRCLINQVDCIKPKLLWCLTSQNINSKTRKSPLNILCYLDKSSTYIPQLMSPSLTFLPEGLVLPGCHQYALLPCWNQTQSAVWHQSSGVHSRNQFWHCPQSLLQLLTSQGSQCTAHVQCSARTPTLYKSIMQGHTYV